MAKHVWTVFCRRGVLDKYTNTVCLLDALEGAEFFTNPHIEEGKNWTNIPFEGALVSFFVRSDQDKTEESRMKIEILAPDGTAFPKETISKLDLVQDHRCRAFTFFKTLPFWASGTFKFIVLLESESGAWEKVAEVPFDVKQVKQPATGESPSPPN